MKNFKTYKGLLLIGLMILSFLIFKNDEAIAAPKGTCKTHKTNICYIGPLGYEVKGIWYIEIK